MRTVYKYVLNPAITNYDLPFGAVIRHVDSQGDNICLWAEVETEVTQTERRFFHVFGTGHPIPLPEYYKSYEHIGSVKMYEGSLIFHVYEFFTKDKNVLQ